jgi:hypothetical protein
MTLAIGGDRSEVRGQSLSVSLDRRLDGPQTRYRRCVEKILAPIWTGHRPLGRTSRKPVAIPPALSTIARW